MTLGPLPNYGLIKRAIPSAMALDPVHLIEGGPGVTLEGITIPFEAVMSEAQVVLDQIEKHTPPCEHPRHAWRLLVLGWCGKCPVNLCVLDWWWASPPRTIIRVSEHGMMTAPGRIGP